MPVIIEADVSDPNILNDNSFWSQHSDFFLKYVPAGINWGKHSGYRKNGLLHDLL